LPILTNDGTSIGYFTVQASLGWSVTYNDTGEIIQALEEFAKTTLSRRETLKKNLLAFYASQKRENDAELDRIKIRVKELLGGSL
jgi:hypothetical protein